jgi:hypothetical protein
MDLFEVLLAHTKERCAIDFRVPPHAIVQARLEGTVATVIPRLLGLVGTIDEHGF